MHTNFSLYRLDELGPEEERAARAIVSELERQDVFMLGQLDWPLILVDGNVDLVALVRAIDRQTGEKT